MWDHKGCLSLAGFHPPGVIVTGVGQAKPGEAGVAESHLLSSSMGKTQPRNAPKNPVACGRWKPSLRGPPARRGTGAPRKPGRGASQPG